MGYGDIALTNTLERIFVTFLMLIGVYGFSFATGSLASIMQNLDAEVEEVNERLMLLENLNKIFSFSPELYQDIKNSMTYENIHKDEDLEELLCLLPQKLRAQVIADVHKDLEMVFPIFS